MKRMFVVGMSHVLTLSSSDAGLRAYVFTFRSLRTRRVSRY
jgi:hypothetical protein